MTTLFGYITTAMGYVYHFVMCFIAPLNAPLNELSGYSVEYYNPFFNYTMETIKLQDTGIDGFINAINDFLLNILDSILEFFNIPFFSADMPFWALLLIATAITGAIVLSFRTITNIIN